jgi:hypothetical protein
MLCAFRPNVFLDISAFQSMPVEHLRPLFARGINHKIIFGTDWPLFRLQGTQRSFVDVLLDDNGPLAGLRPRELDGLFRGTIERLLGSGLDKV